MNSQLSALKQLVSGPTRSSNRLTAIADESLDATLVASLADAAVQGTKVSVDLSDHQIELLTNHRLIFLLNSRDGTQGDQLKRLQRRSAKHWLRLEATARSLDQAMGSSGIEFRYLKGYATAHLDYKNPSQRFFGDLDLLVRPDQLDDTVTTLQRELGCEVKPRSTIDGRFGKGLTLVADHVELDLHTRLVRYANWETELLFSDPETLPHSTGSGLPLELRLVHAAAHLAFTPPGLRRLSGLVDISVMRADPLLDLELAFERANQLGVASASAWILRIEAEVCGRGDDLGGWPEPSFLERQSFARETRRLGMEHVLALRPLSGSDRLAYLRQRLRPETTARATESGLEYYRKLAARDTTRDAR